MGSITRILCPVDGSELAARALRCAAALAGRFDAQLTVLTVRPPMPALGIWASTTLLVPPAVPDEREQAFAAFERFVRNTTGSPGVRVLLHEGPVVGEILREAQEWPAELIVMGTHGASGCERLVLGSVTEKVLRRTSVPVLTIPREAAGAPNLAFATILCALDRSAAAARALDYAVGFARGPQARLVVAHVVETFLNEDPQFSRHFDTEGCFRAAEPAIHAWYAARIPAEARAAGEVDVVLRSGKAARELLALAGERHADLIVVGTASSAAMFGSTAHDIVRAANVPVLVVPPPAAVRADGAES